MFLEAFISGTDETYLQQVYTMHVFYPKVPPRRGAGSGAGVFAVRT